MIAQLGECQTEDLNVPGSIPGRGMILFSYFFPSQNVTKIHSFFKTVFFSVSENKVLQLMPAWKGLVIRQ